MTDKDLRVEFAEKLNSVTRKELFQYGITRVSDVTNIDIIGIPVFTTDRPGSRTISGNSGKGLTKNVARAGAIMEGCEMNISENPSSEFILSDFDSIRSIAVDWRNLSTVNGCILHDKYPLAWEPVSDLLTGESKLFPSSLIWLHERNSADKFKHFQSSTSGLASGVSENDAIRSALYECIERDACTIGEYLADNGAPYQRISVEGLEEIEDKIRRAGLYLFLYDLTSSVGVPTVKAHIVDVNDPKAGFYAGFGCDRHLKNAATRAAIEAVQSRCVYLTGTRDDLMRRSFMVMKSIDQKEILRISLACEPLKVEYDSGADESDVDHCLRKIRDAGFGNIYCKIMHKGSLVGQEFTVAKAMVPGMEVPRFESWHPSARAKECLKQRQ